VTLSRRRARRYRGPGRWPGVLAAAAVPAALAALVVLAELAGEAAGWAWHAAGLLAAALLGATVRYGPAAGLLLAAAALLLLAGRAVLRYWRHAAFTRVPAWSPSWPRRRSARAGRSPCGGT